LSYDHISPQLKADLPRATEGFLPPNGATISLEKFLTGLQVSRGYDTYQLRGMVQNELHISVVGMVVQIRAPRSHCVFMLCPSQTMVGEYLVIVQGEHHALLKHIPLDNAVGGKDTPASVLDRAGRDSYLRD
jgi:hypothetical protein